MKITGITFIGTRTHARSSMASFLRDVLGLVPAAPAAGMDADVFDLPDGSSFAVAPGVPPDEDDRTIGFSVDDLEGARAAIEAAGVWVDEISVNDRFRYVHFRAPDGHLYELVEERVHGA
jgi:glyoxylase I family protein